MLAFDREYIYKDGIRYRTKSDGTAFGTEEFKLDIKPPRTTRDLLRTGLVPGHLSEYFWDDVNMYRPKKVTWFRVWQYGKFAALDEAEEWLWENEDTATPEEAEEYFFELLDKINGKLNLYQAEFVDIDVSLFGLTFGSLRIYLVSRDSLNEFREDEDEEEENYFLMWINDVVNDDYVWSNDPGLIRHLDEPDGADVISRSEAVNILIGAGISPEKARDMLDNHYTMQSFTGDELEEIVGDAQNFKRCGSCGAYFKFTELTDLEVSIQYYERRLYTMALCAQCAEETARAIYLTMAEKGEVLT